MEVQNEQLFYGKTCMQFTIQLGPKFLTKTRLTKTSISFWNWFMDENIC